MEEKRLSRYYELATHSEDYDTYLNWYFEKGATLQQYNPLHCAMYSLMSVNSSLHVNDKKYKRWVETGEFVGLQPDKYHKLIKLSSNAPLTEYDAILNGEKLINFFRNLQNPEDKHYVTIDRHMMDILWGKRIRLRNKRYWEAAAIVWNVSRKYNILPCQLQAATWCIQVKNKNLKKDLWHLSTKEMEEMQNESG